MKITIDELFNYAFVISVSETRLKKFNKIFNLFGLKIPKHISGQKGYTFKEKLFYCQMTHKKIIENAKDNNLPFVCIFEDDAYPCINVYEKIVNFLYNIDYDYDVIYLGYLGKYSDSKFYGSHAYIVLNSGYDKILNYYNTNKNPYPDMLWKIKDLKILKSPENLFIQYNDNLDSMHKEHFKYVSKINESNKFNPPKNFIPVETL